jgi:hypothetical protein
MALSLDSALRKDAGAYDNVKDQATSKSEAIKTKNDDQKPYETFSGGVQTELVPTDTEKILPSTAEIDACNEDDVNDEMAIIEETLPLQHFHTADGYGAASNKEAKPTVSKETETDLRPLTIADKRFRYRSLPNKTFKTDS